jgi:RNA polymerase subunit RPABC4/transcription elongation factor Spt4
MTDFLDMFTNKNQFENPDFQAEDDLLKKTLRDGNNDFRIVGRGRYFYVHRFDAANGVRVMSICPKDEDGNGECDVCVRYKNAWKVVNEHRKAEQAGESSPHDADTVRLAEVIAGERANPLINFKQSWGPKRHIALNVIDRDSDVNFKEKHTSLLCKSNYDKGISAGKKGIYEEIVKLLNRHRDEIKNWFQKGKDYLPFDIRLIREGKGMDTSYDKEKLESRDLTPEELALERYDLDELIKPTDLGTVKTWLTKGTKQKEKSDDKNQQKTSGSRKSESERVESVFPTKTSKSAAQTTQPAQAECASESTRGSFRKKELPKVEPQEEMDACPECNKMIAITSSKCKYCGTEFETDDEPTVVVPPPKPAKSSKASKSQTMRKEVEKIKEPEEEMDACPNCDKMIPVTSTKCKHCGTEFEGYQDDKEKEAAPVSEDEIPF